METSALQQVQKQTKNKQRKPNHPTKERGEKIKKENSNPPEPFVIINQNMNRTLKIISDCLATHHIITRDTFDHKKSWNFIYNFT